MPGRGGRSQDKACVAKVFVIRVENLEREVESVLMLLCCQIHNSQMVAQEQARGLGFGGAINQRTRVYVCVRSVGTGRVAV